MNWKAIVVAIGLTLGLNVVGGAHHAQAQEGDQAAVKAVINSLHSTLSSLDAKKMETLWAHEPYVMLINPRDKAITIGWQNVNKGWVDLFGAYTQLKVTDRK